MKRLNIPRIFILSLLLSIIELFIEFGIPEGAKEIGMQGMIGDFLKSDDSGAIVYTLDTILLKTLKVS